MRIPTLRDVLLLHTSRTMKTSQLPRTVAAVFALGMHSRTISTAVVQWEVIVPCRCMDALARNSGDPMFVMKGSIALHIA
mmetsp:Transcript_6282/g.18962  ORF Transcript_6282/g.18962 Transcript_6282/m.18962 type:complete len:80 (+) Transcript_6282:381-620(+)